MNDKRYFLPDRLYLILKWVGLALLPALAVLVGTIGDAWGFSYVDQTVTTLNALGIFIAAIIGYSQLTAKDDE